MSQPNPSPVDDLIDLVKSEWDSDTVNDDRLVIAESDSIGKGRDLGVYDYIECSETGSLSIDYHDLFMRTQDVDATVYVELKASNKGRRAILFDEFRRIIEAHRKRPDTPGGYDRMIFEPITPLDDDTFGAYVYEIVIGFESRSRRVNA